jgi:predicted ATP-binding protein involved in virulence
MLKSSDVPRLSAVRLTNVRGFKSLTLDLGSDPSSLRRKGVLVIGRNGTNKSTLLRAISVGLASQTDASAMLSIPLGSMIRTGETEAKIELDLLFENGEDVTLTKTLVFRGDRDVLGEMEGPTAEELNLLVAGYGAARGITGTDAGRSYRVFDAVQTLFDYRRELLSPELVLRRLQDQLGTELYEKTLAGIAKVMGLEGRAEEIAFAKGGGVVVSSPDVGIDVPLEGVADGYRVVFNWLIDMYGRALRPEWITEQGSVAGVILVDELDQHLHPELQSAVMHQLVELLPDAQVIATTHSPLIALGADPQQLIVLERHEDRVVSMDRVPDYRGYSAEDMLADDRLFATGVWSPDTEAKLTRYEELVATGPDARTEEHTSELRKLAESLRELPLPQVLDEEVRESAAQIQEVIKKQSS